MDNKEFFKELLIEYDVLKYRAQGKFNTKINEFYQKCNRLKEIDEEISQVGPEVAKIIIQKNQNSEKLLQNLKNELTTLNNEREILMKENGFDKILANNIYICNTCKDTGFINNKTCKCFKIKLIEKAYKLSNLSIVSENFDNFSLDYYSKDYDENYKISPYEQMRRIKIRCAQFSENFDNSFENMVFSGSSGLGKTFLAKAIGKDILNRGKTVLYITAYELFEVLEKSKFSKEMTNRENYFSTVPKIVDLLIIDDLGTEFNTLFSNVSFFDIINSRLNTKKSTIISTNLDKIELEDMYSERILSRLYGEYKIFTFLGDDIRIQNKTRNNKK